MITCVLLNPAVDVVYELDEFRPGATRIDVLSRILPAGKGVNVAKAVAILGEKACVAALMPANDSRRFRIYLEDMGIECRFHEIDGCARINATIVEGGPMQVTHINSRGAGLSIRIQDEMVDFLGNTMSSGDMWVLAGSVPSGFEDTAYQKLADMCRGRGITVLLDTRGKALCSGVRARPAMVKPNLSELEAFFGEQIQGVHHIALKAKRLLDIGVDYAFISLGADGMIAVHKNECLLCSPPRIDAVDTVGCGDALDAGITVGYARGFSFREMCRMAVACGASNALHPGAGVISREEVWQLMEDVKIEAV